MRVKRAGHSVAAAGCAALIITVLSVEF